MDLSSNNFLKLWCFCIIAAGGGFLLGYDWVVILSAQPYYEAYFGITDPAVSGWTMASDLLGCVIGATLTGVLADNIGRKNTLFFTSVLFILSALGTAYFNQLHLFIISRIIGGVAIGIVSGASPMYIAELSPAHSRGKMILLNQLGLVLGIACAQLSNVIICQDISVVLTQEQLVHTWNGLFAWRYMFLAEAVPAMCVMALIPLLPESPRYLVFQNKTYPALKVIALFRGMPEAEQVLSDIMQSLRIRGRVTLCTLMQKRFRRVLTVAIFLAVFQQWCGSSVLFTYAHDIFEDAGFGINDSKNFILLTGSVNLLFTLIAMPMVDIIGRRCSMIFGSASLMIVFALMTLTFVYDIAGMPTILLIMVAIAIYALTIAPATWILLAELFPTAIRSKAMALTTFILWVSCFVLTYSFPILNEMTGSAGAFAVYSFICLCGLIFIYYYLPETKDYTLEEIEKFVTSPKPYKKRQRALKLQLAEEKLAQESELIQNQKPTRLAQIPTPEDSQKKPQDH